MYEDVMYATRSPTTLTRAHPGQSPARGRNKLSVLRLLLLFIVSLRIPDVGAKEAVIFEHLDNSPE
jgi:hypothetical protein